ncbi:hypothetical protein PR048_004551 [Dryococelus australis]|uniref:Uncharacterized protein n=1 Tax=Dryococelus australis TaxID=614101 RepID=A0ABQ9I5R5_9NEOP|nr:hypothetical protein PR048_004551 [Dryococelus australis]
MSSVGALLDTPFARETFAEKLEIKTYKNKKVNTNDILIRRFAMKHSGFVACPVRNALFVFLVYCSMGNTRGV